jgi:tetratricopeptide (TPR) repeat protein
MRLLAAAVTAIALCVPSVWSAEPHGFLLPLTAAKPSQDKDATPLPEPASSIDRSLAGKESHTYQMELSEGQYVGIVVVQRGIDVVVQVLDGGGQSLADFDSESRIEGQEEVGFVSDSAGVYRVRVKARYPRNSAGRYELKCLEVRAANEMDRGIYESHRLSTESGTLNDAGKYDEALDRAQRALDVGERALGPDDPFVGFLATRLGQALRTKGDLAKAETVAQRAVSINERTLGEGNPLTASAVQGLGLVYRSLDDNTKAEQLFQRALEIFEKSLGNDHPRTANCLMLLALEDEDRGDFDLAISMLQRALAIADKTVDPDEYLPMAQTRANSLFARFRWKAAQGHIESEGDTHGWQHHKD